MADTRISNLNALTASISKTLDEIAIEDDSANETKKINIQNLASALAITDIGDVGTFTQTKGKILVSSGTNLDELGVGTNTQVLTADSAETLGIKWAAAQGGVITRQRDELTADETTTSTTFVNSNLSLTLANRSGGFFMASCAEYYTNDTVAFDVYRFVEGATNINAGAAHIPTVNQSLSLPIFLTGTLDGDVLKIEWRVTAGTGKNRGASDVFSHLEVLELS